MLRRRDVDAPGTDRSAEHGSPRSIPRSMRFPSAASTVRASMRAGSWLIGTRLSATQSACMACRSS